MAKEAIPNKKPSLDDLRQNFRSQLPELRQKYGVVGLWVFGSYVRGEQKRSSDLDILIEFDNPHLSLLEFVGLEKSLSQKLGVKVDLVEKKALKPAIGKRILAEAQTV